MVLLLPSNPSRPTNKMILGPPLPMRLIENQDDLYFTFSKRRLGLHKNASELSNLCGSDTGIIIFSPTDNPFSFFHPNTESVVQRYRNPNQPMNEYGGAKELPPIFPSLLLPLISPTMIQMCFPKQEQAWC